MRSSALTPRFGLTAPPAQTPVAEVRPARTPCPPAWVVNSSALTGQENPDCDNRNPLIPVLKYNSIEIPPRTRQGLVPNALPLSKGTKKPRLPENTLKEVVTKRPAGQNFRPIDWLEKKLKATKLPKYPFVTPKTLRQPEDSRD